MFKSNNRFMTHFLAAAALLCAMTDTVIDIEEVTISYHTVRTVQTHTTLPSIQLTHDYLQQNFSGSLMQTLQGIPGVKAMSIGSGQSKPTIRGLGFNRMAVAEDGIKHEGQQWGDDHGLEIDQFAIDRVEVIKGPAALLYGSDAIGGVICLYTNHIPTDSLSGAVQLFGRSNNGQLGASAKLGLRAGKLFCRANFTIINYGDYKVPTDSIQYYSYYIRLKDQRLRNTAGLERDGSLMFGYAGYNFHTDLRVSDSYAKSGFFANAHGLEVRLSDIDYDRSKRDIDLPHQWVNHLKVLSHSSWRTERLATDISLAYQQNRREECSEPVSHGYMPTPGDEVERHFDKSTYTACIGVKTAIAEHSLNAGVNAEYQHNRRSGWGFIIPDFETGSVGAYLLDKWQPTDNLKLNAGLRYDHAKTHISSYNDWYLTPVGTDSVYKQRSADIDLRFNNLTWSVGGSYETSHWALKANLGKSFRIPIPKELGADGINYHIFRYERGNAELNPEVSYQFDLSTYVSGDLITVQVEPYVNYFPNYIYLNPTAQYEEGLQLYHYTQTEVLRYGVECQTVCRIARHFEAELKGEYLYAEQLSGAKKGYTLPFSTPWSADAGVKYSHNSHGDGSIGLNVHLVGKQDNIVPPEKPTDGYWTLNLSANHRFRLTGSSINVSLHADNLLNKRYYDHTSYYRLIDVPEAGRNFAVMVGWEF